MLEAGVDATVDWPIALGNCGKVVVELECIVGSQILPSILDLGCERNYASHGSATTSRRHLHDRVFRATFENLAAL